jgi:hypothetical protein
MREANLSGALQKAANLYIEEMKQNPEFERIIDAINQRYSNFEKAAAELDAGQRVVPLMRRRRGRPPKLPRIEQQGS